MCSPYQLGHKHWQLTIYCFAQHEQPLTWSCQSQLGLETCVKFSPSICLHAPGYQFLAHYSRCATFHHGGHRYGWWLSLDSHHLNLRTVSSMKLKLLYNANVCLILDYVWKYYLLFSFQMQDFLILTTTSFSWQSKSSNAGSDNSNWFYLGDVVLADTGCSEAVNCNLGMQL